jgi:hypothetical protein
MARESIQIDVLPRFPQLFHTCGKGVGRRLHMIKGLQGIDWGCGYLVLKNPSLPPDVGCPGA